VFQCSAFEFLRNLEEGSAWWSVPAPRARCHHGWSLVGSPLASLSEGGRNTAAAVERRF